MSKSIKSFLHSSVSIPRHQVPADKIKDYISQHGPISFRDFMEMALYDPQTGYYTTGKNKIGPDGDYITAPTATSLPGIMIANQIHEIQQYSGMHEFTIVESGAGSGALCKDILSHLREISEHSNKISYLIIEKSPGMKSLQKKLLVGENITWFDSIGFLPEITGCFISNEVVDNFPVHKVRMRAKLQELFIDVDPNGELYETSHPASQELCDYFDNLNVRLPNGYTAEVNLDAIEWIRQIAKKLKAGFVITMDYGHLSDTLYNDSRRNGTILCYRDQKVNNQPLQDPGLQDITSFVNFSALIHYGDKYGLTNRGYTSQGNFFRGLGITSFIRQLEQFPGRSILPDPKRNSLLNLLVAGMGQKIRVLIQSKKVKRIPLSGLTIPYTSQNPI